jgi:hypothetical protein
MIGGAAASATGMALLAAAVARHHLPVFLAATAISGAGYSLLFFGGLATINSAAQTEHRGGVLSAIYLLAYVSLGAVSLLLGAVGDRAGARFRGRPRRRRDRSVERDHCRFGHDDARRVISDRDSIEKRRTKDDQDQTRAKQGPRARSIRHAIQQA